AAAVHLAAMPLALRIPKVHVVGRNPIVDDVELRGSAVTFAANATSAMRAGGAGGFLGSYIATFARRHVNEEMLLALSLGVAGAAALIAPVQFEEPAVL